MWCEDTRQTFREESARALLAARAQPLQTHELVLAQWQSAIRPTDVIEGIRSRDDAERWVLPDEILGPVVDERESWVGREWPDGGTPQTVTRRFLLRAYVNRPDDATPR